MKYKVTVTYMNYEEKEKIFNENEYEECQKYAIRASQDENISSVEVIEYNVVTDRIFYFPKEMVNDLVI